MFLAFASLVTAAAGAAADDALSGTDLVRSKNVEARTLLIGEETYEVPRDLTIRAADGSRLRLADLDVPGTPDGGLVPVGTLPLGRYEAVRSRDRLRLRSLELIESPE